MILPVAQEFSLWYLERTCQEGLVASGETEAQDKAASCWRYNGACSVA